jgi:protein SCO1/2
MRSYRYLLMGILSLCTFNCTGPDRSKDPVPDQLPFFRDALLTPEWMSENDPARDSICRIPAFTLSDQTNAQFTEKGMDDRICVTNFFFSRCRSICPRMTLQLKYLRDTLGNAPDVRFLSFSVDPEADSVSILADYAEKYGMKADTWKLLTGPREAIYRLARKGFFAGDSTGLTSTSDEFLHTENVILTDGKRRIRGVYNGTLRVEMDRLHEDILMLRREKISD